MSEAFGYKVMDSRQDMPLTVGSTVLDDWRIVRSVGSGGFGRVFEIRREVYNVEQRSALKVVSIPQDPNYMQSMQDMGLSMAHISAELQRSMDNAVREVRTMVRLQEHPHIVRCEGFDVFRYDDDGTWDILIRMELLTPMLTWLKSHELNEKTALKMGLEISDLLSYCDQEHILHRDIKPANIFVNRIGLFKLGDFGLARAVTATTSSLSHAGTPPFMAPEVFQRQDYGPSADVYSLGLVLYWMLNGGALPFMDGSSTLDEAVTARMSSREIPRLTGIDPALAEVVAKAVAYRPEDRFRNGTELHEALAECKQGKGDKQPAPEPAPQEPPRTPVISEIPGMPSVPTAEPREEREQRKVDGFVLEVLDENTCRAVRYDGNDSMLRIPGRDDRGRTVTEIGRRAFQDERVTQAVIPGTVRRIDDYAFSNTHLERLEIPDGVQTLGRFAFAGCDRLRTARLPDSVTELGDSCFRGCTQLESLSVPASVRMLGENVFRNCGKLTLQLAPGSAAHRYAEENSLPFTLTGIARPVTPAPVSPAQPVNPKPYVHPTPAASPLKDFSFESVSGGCQIKKYVGNDAVVVIPQKDAAGRAVLAVGNAAFQDCKTVEKVVVPEGVKRILSFAFAFYGSSRLTEIELPASLETIDGFAFRGSQIQTIRLPAGLTSLGYNAFEDCTKLQSITLPDKLTRIQSACFKNCRALTVVRIPLSVTSIEHHAFQGCTGMKTLTLSKAVQKIGLGAFKNCPNLTVRCPKGSFASAHVMMVNTEEY